MTRDLGIRVSSPGARFAASARYAAFSVMLVVIMHETVGLVEFLFSRNAAALTGPLRGMGIPAAKAGMFWGLSLVVLWLSATVIQAVFARRRPLSAIVCVVVPVGLYLSALGTLAFRAGSQEWPSWWEFLLGLPIVALYQALIGLSGPIALVGEAVGVASMWTKVWAIAPPRRIPDEVIEDDATAGP